MTDYNTPSPEQIAYVRALQKRLRLPNTILDNHCVATFNTPFADLHKREASRLIDQMIGWDTTLPADLIRAKGQLDLFGVDR